MPEGVSRQLEALSIRVVTPRCQREGVRTNGRRGVPEQVGRLNEQRQTRAATRIVECSPKAFRGGLTAPKRGRPTGSKGPSVRAEDCAPLWSDRGLIAAPWTPASLSLG